MHRPAGLRPTRSLLAGFVVMGAILATSTAASAASPLNLTVNSTADTHAVNPGSGRCADAQGHCSLRAATEVANAQAAGRLVNIKVPAGTFKVSHGFLTLKHNPVVVTGAGATTTVVTAQGVSRVLTVAANAKVTLNHLELTGGRSQTGTFSQNGSNGGGILNAGSLTIANSTVTGNTAGSGGQGLNDTAGSGGNGGGIANTGVLSVAGSTISANATGWGGIGLYGNELSGNGGQGGGIYSASGSVTLTNSVVSGNASGNSGPSGDGPANAGDGGGVWSSATLIVTGSTFSANIGGNATGAGANGGGIFSSGTATVSSSMFSSNTAGQGDLSAGNGGAIANTGTLSMTKSTLSKNAAGAGVGGAPGGNGGGLDSNAGKATLTGDTLNANASGKGGDAIIVDPGCFAPGRGGNGGGIYSSAGLGVTNTTLSGNTTGAGGFYQLPCAGQAPSGVGGGLATAGGTATMSYATVADNADGIVNLAGTVTLGGTIVADSTPNNGTTANCTGVISETVGYNLDTGTTCGLGAITDITGTEPLLGVLAANGGPTYTQALQVGSPAIDHGGTAGTGCPAVDQRGSSRPDEVGDAGTCDIGAYESQGIG